MISRLRRRKNRNQSTNSLKNKNMTNQNPQSPSQTSRNSLNRPTRYNPISKPPKIKKPQPNLIKSRQQSKKSCLTLKRANKKKMKSLRPTNKKKLVERPRKKMNEKIMEENNENAGDQFQEADIFMCPLCQRVFVFSVETECGHCFCEQCLDFYFQGSNRCPVCEKKIHPCKITRMRKIDEIISDFMNSLEDPLSERYHERVKARKEQKQNAKLQNFELGAYVDVRDHSYKWHQGMIVKKHAKKIHGELVIKSVSVNYMDSEEKQVIKINSERLKKSGSYTEHVLFPKALKNVVVVEGKGGRREEMHKCSDEISDGVRIGDDYRMEENEIIEEQFELDIDGINAYDGDDEELEGMYDMYEDDNLE